MRGDDKIGVFLGVVFVLMTLLWMAIDYCSRS